MFTDILKTNILENELEWWDTVLPYFRYEFDNPNSRWSKETVRKLYNLEPNDKVKLNALRSVEFCYNCGCLLGMCESRETYMFVGDVWYCDDCENEETFSGEIEGIDDFYPFLELSALLGIDYYFLEQSYYSFADALGDCKDTFEYWLEEIQKQKRSNQNV